MHNINQNITNRAGVLGNKQNGNVLFQETFSVRFERNKQRPGGATRCKNIPLCLYLFIVFNKPLYCVCTMDFLNVIPIETYVYRGDYRGAHLNEDALLGGQIDARIRLRVTAMVFWAHFVKSSGREGSKIATKNQKVDIRRL